MHNTPALRDKIWRTYSMGTIYNATTHELRSVVNNSLTRFDYVYSIDEMVESLLEETVDHEELL